VVNVHLTLNITVKPIANKYCEGKLKKNFEKRVNRPETVEKEAVEDYYLVLVLLTEVNFPCFGYCQKGLAL
jgi:hypothetical protein